MDGKPCTVSRFAATLRRKLFRGKFAAVWPVSMSICVSSASFVEHLGLIPPQIPMDEKLKVTSFMRPAPYGIEDETAMDQDVADPIVDSTLRLWAETARTNSNIYNEIFRPMPNGIVKTWSAYEVFHSCLTVCIKC